MGIDIETEELIHFPQARKEFPRPTCIATLHRWRLRGVRGVVLETILVGGLRYTSREAIGRFIAAQNADNPSQQPAPVMTAPRRQRQAAAAMATLAQMGVTTAD